MPISREGSTRKAKRHTIMDANRGLTRTGVQNKPKKVQCRRESILHPMKALKTNTSRSSVNQASSTNAIPKENDTNKPKKIQIRRESIIRPIKNPKANKSQPNVDHGSSTNSTPTDTEKVRENCRKHFYRHMKKRTNEERLQMPAAQVHDLLTKQEIREFVHSVEEEMFRTFGCDKKYHNKYRELVFNIEDGTNKILFLNVSRKIVTPQELVHMTTDQLASPERLAEREGVKQRSLNSISHTEKDRLACPAMYIKKTHKGDEIIVHRQVKPVYLDPNTEASKLVKELNTKTGANIGDTPYRAARIIPRRLSRI